MHRPKVRGRAAPAKPTLPVSRLYPASASPTAGDWRPTVGHHRSPNSALIRVDVQECAFEKGAYGITRILKNVTALRTSCRGRGVTVRFISHHDETRRPEQPGRRGWKISRVSRSAPPRSYLVPDIANTRFDNGEMAAEEIYVMFNREKFCRRFAAVRSFAELVAAIRST